MSQPPKDRRRHRRVAHAQPIRYRFKTVEHFVTEHSVDISASGMFIRSEAPPEVGTVVFLQFMLEEGSRLVEGTARVIRVVKPGEREPAGCAVEFQDLDQGSRDIIEAICWKKANG